jgi:hypothetical protein
MVINNQNNIITILLIIWRLICNILSGITLKEKIKGWRKRKYTHHGKLVDEEIIRLKVNLKISCMIQRKGGERLN